MLIKCLVAIAIVALGATAQFRGQDTPASAQDRSSGEDSTRPSHSRHVEFKLIEFRLATDYDWVDMGGRLERRVVGRPDSVAYALVDIGSSRAKAIDSEAVSGDVVFELVSDNGDKRLVEAIPHTSSSQTNVVCLPFYPGTGDKFVAPKLVASVDGAVVAEWNLPSYPTDARVIPADEDLVVEAKGVAGLDISASAKAFAYERPSTRFTGSVNLELSVDGRFDPDCRYWVYYEVPETTWRKEAYTERSGFLVSEPKSTGTSKATEYAANADRMRVTGSVERTKVYTEAAVFRGIEFVGDPDSDQIHVVNRREQRAVLSTGVEVVLPKFDNLSWTADDGTSLELRIDVLLPGGTTNVGLRGHPSSRDGAKIKIGKTLSDGRWHGAGGSGGNESWTTGFRADPDEIVRGRKFDFSIEIEHIVLVARDEFRLLIPIERLDPTRQPPALTDQEFMDGNAFGNMRARR